LLERQVENVKQLHERERERERERESGAIGRRTGLVDRAEGRLNGGKRHRSINHLVDQPRRPCFRVHRVAFMKVEVEVEVEVVAQLLVRLAAVVKPLRRWAPSPSTMASLSTAASPSRAAPRRERRRAGSGGAVEQGAAAAPRPPRATTAENSGEPGRSQGQSPRRSRSHGWYKPIGGFSSAFSPPRYVLLRYCPCCRIDLDLPS